MVESIVNDSLCGDVSIRNFDIGIYRALDYVIIRSRAYVPLSKASGVEPPLFDENHDVDSEIGMPMPGFPIIFANPGDSVQRYNLPCFRITREDPSPALERWMGLHLKSRNPASGATPVQVDYQAGRVLNGYDKYQEQDGAFPYDIPYTVTCEAVGTSARTNAQVMLVFLMKKFKPYSVIEVEDSLGAMRKYNVFVEGPSELSEVSDIRDRSIIHAMSLRVSGELDLSDPREVVAISSKPTFNTNVK